MIGLSGAHERLKYLSDLQALQAPAIEGVQQAHKDRVQFCVWQVGVSTACLLALGQIRDGILEIDSWAVKVSYIIALMRKRLAEPRNETARV